MKDRVATRWLSCLNNHHGGHEPGEQNFENSSPVCRSDLTIPDERPDTHNIACNAAIVAQTNESVTVHWRYAADITEQSFADFLAAYSAAGIPAPFYADYADECFTIHTDGKVDCPVKNGCCRLDDWNNPRNDTKSQKSLDFVA